MSDSPTRELVRQWKPYETTHKTFHVGIPPKKVRNGTLPLPSFCRPGHANDRIRPREERICRRLGLAMTNRVALLWPAFSDNGSHLSANFHPGFRATFPSIDPLGLLWSGLFQSEMGLPVRVAVVHGEVGSVGRDFMLIVRGAGLSGGPGAGGSYGVSTIPALPSCCSFTPIHLFSHGDFIPEETHDELAFAEYLTRRSARCKNFGIIAAGSASNRRTVGTMFRNGLQNTWPVVLWPMWMFTKSQ